MVRASRRRQGCQNAQLKRLHPSLIDKQAMFQTADIGFDQGDFHLNSFAAFYPIPNLSDTVKYNSSVMNNLPLFFQCANCGQPLQYNHANTWVFFEDFFKIRLLQGQNGGFRKGDNRG